MADSLSDFLDAAEAPEAPPADPAPEAPADPVVVDPAPEAEPTSFDRPYVEKIRAEAAKYRTKAKELAEQFAPFESYTVEDRKVWADLAKTMAEDPKAGAKWMKEIADSFLTEAEAPPAPVEEPKYMTRAEYDKLRAEESQQNKIHQIEVDAQKLGYDTDSTDYVQLLLVANRETGGDIHKAHEAIKAKEQAIIDAYVAKQSAAAESSPLAPSTSGTAASGQREIKTFRQASQAVMEALGG